MKNAVYLLVIMTMALFSCTDDYDIQTNSAIDDNDYLIENSKTLLKKMIIKSAEGEIHELEYVYDNNRLIEIKEPDGSKLVFIYEKGVLVTLIRNLGQESEVRSKLSYDSKGRLVKILEKAEDDSFELISKYEYNYEGAVVYSIGKQSLVYIVDNNTGNFVKDIDEYETYDHTYDNMNNPFKNIASKAIISLILNQTFKHNELSYSRTKGENSIDDLSYAITYEYNANGYPIQSRTVFNKDLKEGSVIETEYLYK